MVKEAALIAHLLRRAAFGSTGKQLEEYVSKGYEATVDELLDFPSDPSHIPDSVIRRYHTESSAMMGPVGAPVTWLYRLVSTEAPLQEKMALFWHGVFATATSKINTGKPIMEQVSMLRQHGLGRLPELLVRLSKDPAMIYWLDNHENHAGSINENFGRELLELFSMGVGNYTENDIKEAARAFTGWTIENLEYVKVKTERDSAWPYGKNSWRFEYLPDDHDNGNKQFLGHEGKFNGEDIVEIICEQPATARFISRHLYNFFVADEVPVAQWAYTPPKDPEAIQILSDAYFEGGASIKYMLRVLFNSDFFKAENCWFAKIKSPVDLVVGVLRMTNEFQYPEREMFDMSSRLTFMGQQLMNPPSVEGWHGGNEWIESGTLVERVNFSTEKVGNQNTPGIQELLAYLSSKGIHADDAQGLVDECLTALGEIKVDDDERSALLDHASKSPGCSFEDKALSLLRVIASSPEFQRC